jgi:hypothetical protein
MNFDTTINRQQAPFSGAVAGEQVIKIQSSLRFRIFSVFLLIFLLLLLILIILKTKNQSRVLLNPSFLLVLFEDNVWFEDRWMVASLCDE